ncbi:MAG TPA: desulforedoxin [Dehalococcoidia bacterium]|nr:desulforedoxin [Dehalococcoidia bacterium]
MATKQVGEIYLCNVCGNEVEVIKAGGGTLACCSKDMERIAEKPQTTMVNLPDSGG